MKPVPHNTAVTRPGEERPEDEHANLVTHGLGFLLSILAVGVLMTTVVNGHKPIHIAACTAFL